MQYGEVEKWGEKWSSLTNHFSADFHRKFVKYCTKLSELLKNNGIIFLLKKIKKKLGKNAKKLLVVFSQVKNGLKKVSPKELLFSYASISRLYPCE